MFRGDIGRLDQYEGVGMLESWIGINVESAESEASEHVQRRRGAEDTQ